MASTPASTDVAIGGRIRFRRREVGLTQLELAKAIGVSVQQMQKYEGGQNRIAAARLIDVAAALSTTAGALIDEGATDSPEPRLLNVAGAVDLLKAYGRIVDPAHRRSLLGMARSLASGPSSS